MIQFEKFVGSWDPVFSHAGTVRRPVYMAEPYLNLFRDECLLFFLIRVETVANSLFLQLF